MRRLLPLLILALPASAQFSTTAHHIVWGTALPAKCSPSTGDIFFKTSATIGPYYCSAVNTWTAINGGSGGGTIGGSIAAPQVAVGSGTNAINGFADFVWNEVATVTGMTGLQIGLPEPDLSCCDGPSNSMASISGSFIQENYVAAGTGQFIETDKYAATGTPDSPGDIAPPRVPFNNSFWMHTSGNYNIVAYETIGTLSSGNGVWNWGVYPGPTGSVYTFTESTLGTGELSFKNNLGSVFGFSPLSSSGETEINNGVPVASGGSLGLLDLASINIANSSFQFNGTTCTIVATVVTCT